MLSISGTRFVSYVPGRYIPEGFTLGSPNSITLKYSAAKPIQGGGVSFAGTYNAVIDVPVPNKPDTYVKRRLTITINAVVDRGFESAAVSEFIIGLANTFTVDNVNRLAAGGFPMSIDQAQ